MIAKIVPYKSCIILCFLGECTCNANAHALCKCNTLSRSSGLEPRLSFVDSRLLVSMAAITPCEPFDLYLSGISDDLLEVSVCSEEQDIRFEVEWVVSKFVRHQPFDIKQFGIGLGLSVEALLDAIKLAMTKEKQIKRQFVRGARSNRARRHCGES